MAEQHLGGDSAVTTRRRWWLRIAPLWRQKLGLVGCILLLLMALAALAGPYLVWLEPGDQHLGARLLPPLAQSPEGLHLFGTDHLGRDLFARSVAGARASMSVVLVGIFVGAGLGVTLGIIAGYQGRWADNLIMRLVDAQLALPTLVLAMFVAALLGTGFWNTAITLGVATWPIYARLIRADTMRIREEDYISAGIMLGSGDLRIVGRHVVPNLVGGFAVVASLELGRLILIESSLSFIGLGMQPPAASWGSMIRSGQDYIHTAWWLSAIPGVLIMITVLALNLIGDWLRDLLDPHHDS